MAAQPKAEFKNQHYVPRTHLRPFSHGGEGKAIDLYAETQGRVIPRASISGQCSRSYFYGRDGSLEKSLQELEGKYTDIVKEILAYQSGPAPNLQGWLRMFWCAQWGRTEAAAERAKSMFAGAAELIEHPPLAEGPADGRWVLISMASMKAAFDMTADLAAALLVNQAGTPLLTSDNPAVEINKLHRFDRRMRGPGHGLASAGVTLLLPLSPNHAVIYYDRDVYQLPKGRDVVLLKKAEDVHALNELQVLNCHRNTYFDPSFPHAWIHDAFTAAKEARARSPWDFRFAVAEPDPNGGERFRLLPKGSSTNYRKGLIITEQVHREPTRWPSFLAWRHRGYAYDTGTGAGVVRRSYMESNPMIRANVIRTGL